MDCTNCPCVGLNDGARALHLAQYVNCVFPPPSENGVLVAVNEPPFTLTKAEPEAITE